MCAPGAHRPEEGFSSPRTGVTGHALSYHVGSLQEQPVFISLVTKEHVYWAFAIHTACAGACWEASHLAFSRG